MLSILFSRQRTQARALGKAWTDTPRSCRIADRAWDGNAFRAWRAQQDTEAVMPARRQRTNPQLYDPERYPARSAREQGLGWLQRGHRGATHYDKYAQRFLGFLYLAAAWIWPKSYLNTT